MSILKDLVGKTFENLLVLSRHDDKSLRRVFWLCQCDCGNTCQVSGDKLVSGRQISCGCQQFQGFKINNLEKQANSYETRKVNFLTSHYRGSAKIRGLCFNLSKEEISELSLQNCYYCGVVPSNRTHSGNKKLVYIYQGIDRKNSDLGYIKGNVLPCCKTCNSAKGIMTKEEFENWASRLAIKYSNPILTGYSHYKKIFRPDLYNSNDIIPDEG